MDLPFAFPFYGEAKTELGINGNGFLSFGEEPSGLDAVFNDPIPTIYPPNDLIAVLWTWLGSGNGVYYQDMADGRFVVTWDDLPHALDGSVRNTFQAVLHEDGTILFQYLEAPPSDRAGPVIGIENASARSGWRWTTATTTPRTGWPCGSRRASRSSRLSPPRAGRSRRAGARR